MAGQARELAHDERAEARVRGEPGADRGAAQADDDELVGHALERPARVLHGLRPAAEHLAPRDRHRVLQMRAAGLHDRALARGVPAQGALERAELGVERPQQLERHETDRRGRDVVRRLSEVDVAVRVNRHVAPAPAA